MDTDNQQLYEDSYIDKLKKVEIHPTQKQYGVRVVLELIQSSKKYLDLYVKEYPKNISNALSFSTNPNCSCRNQLINHYNDNKEQVDQFTANFLQTHPAELEWGTFEEKYQQFIASGTIVKIDKTQEAYSNLIQKMQREKWVFHHMSVTTEDDKYTIFFA